jgi:MFS transporter, PAT family, beta-lactamase induction signal transducer AmpG
VIAGGWDGGRRADRIGHRRAVQGALIIALIAIGALSLINSPALAWPLVIAFGFAYGFWEAVYFASAMAFADLRIAASMYAILMAFANLGMGIGLAVTGSLVDAISYRPTFLLMAVLNLLALPLLNAIFDRAKRPQAAL